ncbi:family 16 glycosylhydrolase [Flavobacterium sp.]|uniref:family 16 glycosylhydrolase n=1 Tax=Flavobacterium sp. TaxID=239 RepID=UPI0022C749F0|nr:family 16 glycosylhydrolase [Flavobacterium sp.]MCZ8367556.1 family 16 glycosylhydrolase [Flavobacterium sp.]
MKRKLNSLLLWSLLALFQTGYAQLDVIYNDLVWSDEFDTNGAVNSTKWHHQTQIPPGGNWYNGEVQHYTNRLDNSFVSNGNLHIVAKRETFTDQNVTKLFTSARLNSKFAFTYGRVDIRAKAPNAQGTWPALWLLGRNINEDGGFFDAVYGNTNWPACGEIDIMEHGIFPNQPLNYIGAAIHTPSSFGNTINKGGIQASDIAQNYHVYSMNWSPNQITFLLDGVAYYTYNPAIKNASTWPFNAEQYLLLNIAMGGFAGSIPANYTQTSMIIDYVRVYQNTVPDTIAPLNFTASVGAVTSSTIQLLLNATDNSGTVSYTITYPGGTPQTVFGTSGQQRSVTIANLTPNTPYTFTITASDASGNQAANNPQQVNASTVPVQGCAGSSNEAQQGTFTTGYNYLFETFGTDVRITFELLDTGRVGLVALLWRQSPFAEFQMTNTTGQTFTYTLTGQTPGATINYAVKFAYAGGLSVTRYFSYVVGSNCALELSSPDALSFQVLNPASQELRIQASLPIDKVAIHDMMGQEVLTAYTATDRIPIQALAPGLYLVTVYAEGQKRTQKVVVTQQ